MNGLIITATDTDAGKTYVTSLLLQALRNRGMNAVGYKPVACGDRQDARKLREVGPEGLSLEDINPVYLKNSTSPYVASLLENTTVDLDKMEKGWLDLAERFEFVLVEGVGGWEVPLAKGVNFSDFAQRLNLPVLFVVNNKLGMLNHAVLTANAIRARGINCIGIVINTIQEEWDTALVTNRGVIEELTGLPILAELISGQDFIDEEPILEALGLN